jgi:Domain of Unknown Function (DUF1080)
MKNTLALFAACAALLLPAHAGEPVSIFNGKDLSGWKEPAGNLWWSVKDGVLVGENDEKLKGSMLYTEKAYGDFEVETEVRWVGEIDSGIMARKPEIQVQFGVSRSLKKDMTCSFYIGNYPEEGRAKGTETLLKKDDWNKVKLRAQGDTFTVWLNGQQVTEYKNAKYAGPGPIGIQVHGGLKMKVEYRNLTVRELP